MGICEEGEQKGLLMDNKSSQAGENPASDSQEYQSAALWEHFQDNLP
ncbi:hypothetical protein GYO_4489 [Bacillus spizizenii TU-B-10]|uniref:Uncharacterized protein n=1 Tax=Bacillus spizizenii (strain DSM 15029 / JCM 12233 / NBRC 101239 / NRRL B-23049 / TU-B-10) TaxID=1052585 RepID=G4NZF9_BACS4|nr:hypothetical protein GYO_4489 [Bacillus spizizenii TU-B-10]